MSLSDPPLSVPSDTGGPGERVVETRVIEAESLLSIAGGVVDWGSGVTSVNFGP